MERRLTRWLPLLILTALAACGGGGDGTSMLPPDGSNPPGDGSMTPGEEALGREVLGLVNTERTSRGLAPVTWHAGLAQVAYEHSWDMFARNFFSHTNPSGEGPADRLERAGITFTALGENIAFGPPTAELVMTLWMNSAGHRANILDGRFERCSVGVYRTAMGPYWTMMLIRE